MITVGMIPHKCIQACRGENCEIDAPLPRTPMIINNWNDRPK